MAQTSPTHGNNGGGAPYMSREHFRERFPNLKPLIRKEWPQVGNEQLEATDGDPDKVIDLVARSTEQSRSTVREQLSHIAELLDDQSIEGRLNRVVAALEDRSKQVMDLVRDDLMPQAEDTMKQNLWKSILISMGFGVLLGVIMGMNVRGR